VGTAKFTSFIRVQRRVDPTEHHVSASRALFSDLVTAKSIGRMDANAHHITCLNSVWVHGLKGLVDKAGSPKLRASPLQERITSEE